MNELTFRLDAFEGPLDLLLHLIAKNKVSIYDIPIAMILEQYMAVLHQARQMDMDIAGDFIAMAAQLLYIKSRMLLPKPPAEEEEDDPRALLVEQLLEYQRMKEITPLLQERFEQGRDIFVKQPEPQNRTAPRVYVHRTEDLVRAARSLLQKAQRRIPPSPRAFTGIVGREPVPVSGRITMILKRFLKQSRLRFDQLFQDATSRSEIVATFLAVLELSKNRRIYIEGEGDETALRLMDPKENQDEQVTGGD